MDVKCITKQQNSSDLWPLKVKRDCIVDKSVKIIKLIKNEVRSILDNFRIVSFPVFGRIPVDSSHFSLHVDSILRPNDFILEILKCSFNKRNCIVDKSLKIIKLTKNAVRLTLDNFGNVGFLPFGRMPVDSSHFSPHFDSILSPEYFILRL